MLARDLEMLLVAEGGAIAGAMIAGYDGSRGWIHRLWVAASRRRSDIGRSLLAEAGLRLRGLG